MMIEQIGYVGGLMLAFCAVPQVYQCVKTGNADGLSKGFLLLWLGGEILMQIYVITKHGFDMPLLINYWFNTLLCLIIGKYMFFPRIKK